MCTCVDKTYFQRSCSYLWSVIAGGNTKHTCKSDVKLNWVWDFNGKELPPNAIEKTLKESLPV